MSSANEVALLVMWGSLTFLPVRAQAITTTDVRLWNDTRYWVVADSTPADWLPELEDFIPVPATPKSTQKPPTTSSRTVKTVTKGLPTRKRRTYATTQAAKIIRERRWDMDASKEAEDPNESGQEEDDPWLEGSGDGGSGDGGFLLPFDSHALYEPFSYLESLDVD